MAPSDVKPSSSSEMGGGFHHPNGGEEVPSKRPPCRHLPFANAALGAESLWLLAAVSQGGGGGSGGREPSLCTGIGSTTKGFSGTVDCIYKGVYTIAEIVNCPND